MDVFDDVDARLASKALLDELKIDSLKKCETFVIEVGTKLQEVSDNKPPRKIEL
jgi:hypothetical protein